MSEPQEPLDLDGEGGIGIIFAIVVSIIILGIVFMMVTQ
jgi:hypothetical protein